MKIYIYDFEDGLQPVLSHLLGLPNIEIRYWDRRGEFSEIETHNPEDKVIIILSKPYDCLERGNKREKYSGDKLGIWGRRNYRYSNPEIYEHINSAIETFNNPLIIHPNDFYDISIRKKVEDYLGSPILADKIKLRRIYEESVDIK